MRVYGWTSSGVPPAGHPIHDDPRHAAHHRQVRAICAADSKAALMRDLGFRISQFREITETGNTTEIDIATASPGVVFITPLNALRRPEHYYREDAKR